MTDPQTMPAKNAGSCKARTSRPAGCGNASSRTRRSRNSARSPSDVVVLMMSAERAEELKSEFGAQLIIERDVDLKLNVDPPRD